MISSYKGWRKLDNYFKNSLLPDVQYHARKNEDPEEFEQHMVAREAERETLSDFHVVERVIDTRDGDEETEYRVKCTLVTHHYPYLDYLTVAQGKA